ncbi:LamG domain-containing protein [Nonomuraea sp. NPDC050643]|uniref:LamG domain-containing protein n=1 Tax=Nonomuraea sp. NPDC050643 TaxID=3155660 RepID=UPI0034062E04
MGLIMPAAVLVATPAQAQAASMPGLVAAYGMEEGDGGTVHDMSGNGHDGTVRDPLWTAGRFGRALRFDGAADLSRALAVPDAAALRPTSAMTLTAWIRPDVDLAGCQVVAKMMDATTFSYGLVNGPGGVRIGGQLHGDHTASPAEEWWYLALVYDGTSVRLTGNGWEGFTVPATGDLDGGPGPLVIGGQGDLSSCFTGVIDEVRLYDRALSNQEIARDRFKAVAPDERPSAPAGLTDDGGAKTAVLSWQAATDDKGITEYEVHRGYGAGFEVSPETKVATVTGLSWTEGCIPEGTYHYRVVAYDTLSQPSDPTGAIQVPVLTPDCPPRAPEVRIEPRTGWARLLLSGGRDDDAVTEVRLHRSTLPGFTPSAETLIATLDPDVWDYADQVPSAATYHYRTVAVDTTSHVSEPSPVSSAYVAGPPDLGSALRAAYGLDEGSGTTVSNTVAPWAYQGTVTNPQWVTGKHGKALKFGYDTTVEATGLPTLATPTVTAWVKPQRADYPRVAALWAAGTQNSFELYAHDRFHNAPVIWADDHRVPGRDPLPIDTWVHLAATYDITYKVLCLYVDGERVGMYSGVDVSMLGPAQLWLGGPRQSGDHLNGGIIDEVRVYDHPLTPQQIRSVMNTPIGPAPRSR